MLSVYLGYVLSKARNHCAEEFIDFLNNEDFDALAFWKLLRSTQNFAKITDDIFINCTKLLYKLL